MSHLPGDQPPKKMIHRMIRVNQAGEYGAARIYKGQLSVLKDKPVASCIKHMLEQEQHHLDTFNQLIRKRRVRPTLLSPLWHGGGYVLGKVSALMGEKAAMACTVAIEEVIDQHYAHQIEILESQADEAELLATLKQFREDERQHSEISLEKGAADASGFKLMKAVIGGVSKCAIWLSTRL